MALEIEIQTGYGVTASYWRITKIDERFNEGVYIELSGYYDQASRLSNKLPLDSKQLFFTDIIDTDREIAYNRIKQSNIIDDVDQNIFSSAIDV